MRDADDSSLVAAAVTGDGSAYGELFALYEKRIYNYAYGILGNPEDAADVAQDAFVRVFQALPGKDASLNFSAYLYRTTHNLAMDAIKHRGRFVGPSVLELEREPALQADPEKVALLAEQQEQTWRAVTQLPENHRAILALRELHEMSYQEIADVMEMPRATVGVLLSRARIKFREAFRVSSIDIDKLAEECRRMLPLLSAYLDDELHETERQSVASHAEECAFCRLALEEMTEASKSYRAILPLLPPVTLARGVRAELADLLIPEEAYAAERSFEESPSESGRASARPRVELGKWLAMTVIVVVVALFIALVSAATVGELRLPKKGPERTTADPASLDGGEVATQPRALDEPMSDTGDSEQLANKPNEPSGSPGQPAGPAATGAGDETPPPTPAQLSPAHNGIQNSNSTVVLTWEAVQDPSGVTYGVDLERYDNGTGTYAPWKTVTGLSDPSLTYRTGETAERWRVWAADGAGNASSRSGWWTIGKMYLIVPGPDIYEPPPLY